MTPVQFLVLVAAVYLAPHMPPAIGFFCSMFLIVVAAVVSLTRHS